MRQITKQTTMRIMVLMTFTLAFDKLDEELWPPWL